LAQIITSALFFDFYYNEKGLLKGVEGAITPMVRDMDAENFRQKIEVLDEDQWQILIGGFLGRSDLKIAESLYTSEQNVRKHFSKMFRHFNIPPERGKKRPMLYALMVRHKDVLVEFLTDWDDVKLLLRMYELLGGMDRSSKQKLSKESDRNLIHFLSQALTRSSFSR
jgi:hypothetical protein